MNATADSAASANTTGSNLWLWFAIVCPGAVLPATFLWAPALATALMQSPAMDLSSSQIGGMFSLELVCGSIATLPAFLWLRRQHWARFAFLFMAVFIVFNLISAWLLPRNFALFLPIQAIVSVSVGSLLILCTRSVGRLPEHLRGRAFGLIIFSQLIVGTVGIAVLPWIMGTFGVGAFFTFQAILMALCLPFCKQFANDFPEDEADRTIEQRDTRNPLKKHGIYALLGPASIFLLYFCLGGIWPFMGTLTGPTGMTQSTMNELLAIASAVGVVGAGSATLMGRGTYRVKALLLGFTALVLCQIVMATVPVVAAGYVSVLVFKYTWTLLAPFMLTVISLHDDSHGNLINSSNLVLGLGTGCGPIICGFILQHFGYQTMFLFGGLVALLAGVAINLSNLKTPARLAGVAD